MPYPFQNPTNKHDLLCPRIFSDDDNNTSLLEEYGFASSSALFEALAMTSRAPPVTHLTPLAAVYSYPDAPPQPLSRSLLVIGVADASLSVVRKLVVDDDDDNMPDCLHKCTIAVKRADGVYASKLREKDVHNSRAFASFLRRLQRQGLVAVLGKDKLGRFGILKPTEDITTKGDYEGQDFAAACFVGQVENVQSYLTQGLSRANNGETAPAPPPSAAAAAAAAAPSAKKEPAVGGGGGGMGADDLWVPPTDGGFAWQPPSSDVTERVYDMGDNVNGSSSLQDSIISNRKRPRGEDDDSDDENEKKFHADAGADEADKFYSGLTRSLETRADSRIFHMRAFNGWVKAIQIQELDPKTKQPGGKNKTKSPLRVLDLACGKGGDLGKWVLHRRGISNYVGIDVARGSLRDAAIRARNMRQKLTKCTLTCADLGADVPGRLKSPRCARMQKLLTWSLQNEPLSTFTDPEFREVRGGGISLQDRFDVVSIQFAIHYMMSNKKRARRFFRTASELLEIGGNLIATTIDTRVVLDHVMNLGLDLHFDDDSSEIHGALIKVSVGGGACELSFSSEVVKRIFHGDTSNSNEDEHLFGLEYTFTLKEGSDHASGVGDAVNLPGESIHCEFLLLSCPNTPTHNSRILSGIEWLTPIPVLKKLGEEAGLELEYAQNFHEFFNNRKDPALHASAHSSLYSMKVLNRRGSISSEEWEISRLYAALKFRKVGEPTVDLEDEDNEKQEDDEEDDDEIDPAIKAKFLPMAMIQAKRAAGGEVWKSLSSEEKTRLTNDELRRFAK